MTEPQPLYDFRQTGVVQDWAAINDGVMGGVSTGSIASVGSRGARFSGALSLENNGGFASVRSMPRRWELGGCAGLAIRVCGDGRPYKLNLKQDSEFDGINYRVEFTTIRETWQTWRVPFAEFEASFRGCKVPDAAPLDPAAIQTVGFMISDKQEGPFRLDVAWIVAYAVALE